MIKIVCDGCNVELLNEDSEQHIVIDNKNTTLLDIKRHLCHSCSNSLISNIDPRKWAERAAG